MIFMFFGRLFALGNKQVEWKRIAISPSGLYSYMIEEKNENYYIAIFKDNILVFRDDQAYRMQDRFYIVWHQEKDVLWVYSGDIGTYYYFVSDGKWFRKARGSGKSNKSEIPPAMLDAVPILKRLLQEH